MPIRRDCEAPVLPVQVCPDEVVVTEFDPETESFVLTGELLDENCLPIQDENDASILTPIL
jgi:hypothetical protein